MSNQMYGHARLEAALHGQQGGLLGCQMQMQMEYSAKCKWNIVPNANRI